MKILFVNNDGGGFADHVDIPHGTRLEDFFLRQVSGGKSGDYLIKVNRQPAARDYVLVEGDRVTVTHKKIEAGN